VKRFFLLFAMTSFVILLFTGCINPASNITVTIDSPASITVGSTANFSVKLSSSKMGGIGNLFSKDPVITKVTWNFTHTTDTSKSFLFTSQSATTTYVFAAPNAFNTGTFMLSVTAEDKDGNAYSSKAVNNVPVEIKHSVPVYTLQSRNTGDQEIPLSDLKKNQTVKFVMTGLSSQGISASQIQNYQVRWALAAWNATTSAYEEITALIQDYRTYATSNYYQVSIPNKGKFALNFYIKDVFGNVTTFLKAKVFEVLFAIPEIPQLLDHRWTEDGKKYRMVFSSSPDAYYYEIYRQAVSTTGERINTSSVEEFVGRAFVTGAQNVIFEDPRPVKGWVIYSVYAIDGGGTSVGTEFSLNVANRAPEKVKLIAPIGLISSVPDPISGVWAYWTEGEDIDQGDTVTYQVYVKESSNFVLVNSVTTKSASLNYQFTNGVIYSIRVDSADGVNTTTGDVYSFWIKDGIVQQPIIQEVNINYLPDHFYRPIRITFTHENPYGALVGILTRYVIQFSKYSSFAPIYTFEREVWAPGTYNFELPVSYSPAGEPLYARVKAVVSSNRVIFQSNWSNVFLVKK